ncbi:hypothetical protein BDV12DRAFT_179551 [Aspergillus spectabilis]
MPPADEWTIYAAKEQESRRGWDAVAKSLGRQLTTTPQHLSRVLYIPRHDGKTSHLPLYDISSRYAEAVGDTPMGTGKYTVALGMMRRPEGDGTDDIAVSYLVDFTASTEDTLVGMVQYRGLPGQTGDPKVEINGSDADITMEVKGGNHTVPLGTSYPIPPSRTKIGTFRHPYFHYELSSGSELVQLRWETHPVEHGPLRYTLIRSPVGDSIEGEGISSEFKATIEAIYYHIGLGVSLSQSYSEGVLLLPPSIDPRAEAIYVASVLGMLWRLRRLDEAGNEGGKKKSRFGSVKKMLRGG